MELLVLLALIPLANLSFDWASFGVTRALLRRGCEPDAPNPLWLGLIDLVFGLILLVLLAATLIAALAAADGIMAQANAPLLFDVSGRLHQIASAPGNPENYWIYFTLFTTMIPSALNAVIGAISLVSWSWPGQRHWLIAKIPILKESGRGGTHEVVVRVFGLQAFLGTLLAGLALWALWWAANAAAPSALPGLLHLAQWFAAWLGAPTAA